MSLLIGIWKRGNGLMFNSIASQIWFHIHAPVCRCGAFMVVGFIRGEKPAYVCRTCRDNCNLLAASTDYKKLSEEDLQVCNWNGWTLGERFFTEEKLSRK